MPGQDATLRGKKKARKTEKVKLDKRVPSKRGKNLPVLRRSCPRQHWH